MAGYKETPRQKMIGMMYLVLTALLALNVSKEILDAFVVVNDSVKTTNENFTRKVNNLHSDFAKQYSINKDKVGPNYQKAQQAKQLSDALRNYVDSLKYHVIAKTEKIPFDTARELLLKDIKAKDNYDVPTNILLGGESLKKGKGYELMRKIETYRKDMYALVPAKDSALVKIGLVTDEEYRDADGAKQDWVQHNFYHTILAADITIFNKLINEIQNSEYDVVNYLFQGITKEDFKFSGVTARILPSSNYVFQGEPYSAEVFVAAIDETSKPRVDYVMGASEWNDRFVNSATTVEGEGGLVTMRINTANLKPKEYTFAGRIGVLQPDGVNIEYHDFASSFYVAQPSATVSATKMNVFYRGVDNPVMISAAGVPKADLKYSIHGDGQLVNTADGLVVKGLRNKAVQNVTVKVAGKDNKLLGSQEFRVKDLPNPEIFVRSMTPKGAVARQSFLVNPYILCALPEYVNFDYKYKVVGFSMVINKNGDTFIKHANGNQLTQDMKDYIRSARKNTLVVFTDIQVQGPIKKRDVGSFVLKIN